MLLAGQLDFTEEVLVARALPGSHRLVANDGYEAAQIIDCASLSVVAHIPYPELPDGLATSDWYVDPTGSWSLVIDAEQPEIALQLDHVGLGARKIARPRTMGVPSGACWFDPHFQLATFDGLVWGLSDDRLVLEPASEGLLAWASAVTARLPDFERANQIKTDVGNGVAFFLGPDSAVVGTATIPGAEVSVVPGSPEVIDLAGFGGAVWVAESGRVVRAQGRTSEVAFESPADERILGITSMREGTAGLVAVLSAVTGRRGTRMRVFRVEV